MRNLKSLAFPPPLQNYFAWSSSKRSLPEKSLPSCSFGGCSYAHLAIYSRCGEGREEPAARDTAMQTTKLPSQPAKIPGRPVFLAVTRNGFSLRESPDPCRWPALSLGLEPAGLSIRCPPPCPPPCRNRDLSSPSRAFPSRRPRSFASLGAGADGPFFDPCRVDVRDSRNSLAGAPSSFGRADLGPSQGPFRGPFRSVLLDPPAPVSDGSPDTGVGGLASSANIA